MHILIIILLLAAFGKAKAQTSSDSTELCFASDTQAPMWVETLFLKKNNNKNATKKLFSTISERRPGALFIMGDVVNLGYSNRQWKPMDAYLKDLRSKNIAVYAALGNHEVMGQAGKGMRKFQERFPEHKATGYVQIKDSVAVILLNSNFGKLSADENKAQVKWYKETLQQLDADSSIHFIISGCHHSPYTNSKIVGANKDVQEKFVPLFLASKKSKLFITGHSHNFEHFQKDGKDFFVIGGGGGLHQPLRTGADCTADLDADYKPAFHYLSVKRNRGQLKVSSVQLKKDFSCFEDGKSMVISKEILAVNDVASAGSN
ncbi:MAG: metallophosphoesterase [Chitinophagaceae bacterium]|nr:MAG: metallophosphoesterase [Chitinophagaceae bacterium]